MSKECYDYSAILGCHTTISGVKESVVIHYYTDYNGKPATRITNITGDIVVGANSANTTVGACVIDIGEQQVELSDFTLGCALDAQGNAIGPVVLSRRFDEQFGVETQTRVMYPYNGGAPVEPYTGAFGLCETITEKPHLIYLQHNVSTLSMSDIMASTGALRVLSITIKQISGRGVITADSGSGVPMDAGETWSWSAVSDKNADHLSSSALTMVANGEQRITCTYIL